MNRKEGKTPTREKPNDKWSNIVIPDVTGLSETLKRIFYMKSQCTFRLSHTLKQKLVYPKDKTPKHKLNNVVYAVQ